MSIYLGVRTGIHRGARMKLQRSGGCVGRTLGCDVVLADASVQPRHCELRADEAGIHITALAEGVTAHGRPLLVGETHVTLERKFLVDVGRVSLVLVNSRVPKIESSGLLHTPPTPTRSKQASRKRVPPMRRAMTVAGFCAAAFTGYKVVQQGGVAFVPWLAAPSMAAQSSSPLPVSPFSSRGAASAVAAHAVDRFQATLELSSLLSQQPEWRGVKLRHTDANAVELVGVVESREALDRLMREAPVQSLGAGSGGVAIASDLQRNAQEFTRDSSLVTELQSDGKLRIQSHTATPESAQRANDFALQMSRRIEVENRTTYAPKEAKKPRRIELPMRIASVNAAVGFFETEDGTKHFPGATLAKGYVVESIESERILFRVAGKQVEFPIQ
jgi:Inner membrane component of T3SS, cytoplasmic domain